MIVTLLIALLAVVLQPFRRRPWRRPGTADLTAALSVDRLEDLGFEEGDAPKARQFFPPKTVTDRIKIQPLLTPDNYQPHVLDLIKSATKTFYMQTQYIHWSDAPGADRRNPGPDQDWSRREANHQSVRDSGPSGKAEGCKGSTRRCCAFSRTCTTRES